MYLARILNILYRYLWLLVLGGLVASLPTFFQISSQPVSYKATAEVLVGPSLDSPSLDVNGLKIGGQLLPTYTELMGTHSFLAAVDSKLDHKVGPNMIDTALSTRQDANTRVLTLTVYYADPKQAVAIANAAADTLVEMSPTQDNATVLLHAQMSDQSNQLQQVVNESETTIAKLETELNQLKSTVAHTPEEAKANLDQQDLILKQIADERSRSSDAIRTLATIYQVLQGTNPNQLQIIQRATAATSVDPQLWLRVGTSAVGGLIFAIIIMFVAEYFDDRIRYPSDLSTAAGTPMLSTIGQYNRLNGSGFEQLVMFTQPESPAANTYREAVAKLLVSIGESMPYTLLLTSVGPRAGDDTAAVAGNLAIAFAQAGYQVVLVDAQVHNPLLTTLFGSDKKDGLAELVSTNSQKPQLLPIEQVPGIRFLPAGSLSEKTSRAMLNSTNIATMLERLQKEANIVLIAGSPISWFAESLTLASQVNAVILVARHAEARSKIVSKVAGNLRQMKINLAGVMFDYNPSPFMTKESHRTLSAVGSLASKAGILNHKRSNISEQTMKG